MDNFDLDKTKEYLAMMQDDYEVPIQLCSYKDGDFNGVAVLTNRSEIYVYSDRFNTWSKLPSLKKQNVL